jgi:TonB family protein
VIDRTGRVTEIEVAKPCPFGIAEAAIAAVESWRYAPATLNGHPVPVYMTLRVDFSLD